VEADRSGFRLFAGSGLGGGTERREAKAFQVLLSMDPSPRRLAIADREDIVIGLAKRESIAVIARRIGKAPSTVSREAAADWGHGTLFPPNNP